jgi:hypothetical protein
MDCYHLKEKKEAAKDGKAFCKEAVHGPLVRNTKKAPMRWAFRPRKLSTITKALDASSYWEIEHANLIGGGVSKLHLIQNNRLVSTLLS